MTPRPIFQDGERLSATRLNELVDYFREAIQRMALAGRSPGVLSGLRLRTNTAGDEVSIDAGLAIARSGRLLTLLDPLRLNLGEVERSIGVLNPGTYLRPWLVPRRPAVPADPCAHLGPVRIDTRPDLVFRAEPRPTLVQRFWGDGSQLALLPLTALGDESQDSGVPLGALEVTSAGTLRAQPFGRQVATVTMGGIRTTDGDLVATLQGADGPEVTFQAPVRGNDVRASALGLPGQSEATATPHPGAPRILRLAASAGGSSGAVGVPLQVDPAADTIPAGVPLQLVPSDPGEPVRVRAFQPNPPGVTIGVSAAAESSSGNARVVPLAQGGLLEVGVQVDLQPLAQGTWLAARGPDSLGPAGAGQTVLARTAQATPQQPGIHRLLAFVVSPHQMS